MRDLYKRLVEYEWPVSKVKIFNSLVDLNSKVALYSTIGDLSVQDFINEGAKTEK